MKGEIKISSTSPSNESNYTSGFTSEVHFTNIFVNTSINGSLHFCTDIQSELNHQFNDTATVIINCASPISENSQKNNLSFEIYDLLARKAKFKDNTVIIYKYSYGESEKLLLKKNSDLGGTRTPNRQSRNLIFYPVELLGLKHKSNL